jgi:hypothetical protein
MESRSRPQHACDRCGSGEDLYLLTIGDKPLPGGFAAVIRCSHCRGDERIDVAIPIALATPRLLLGLQRMRKLGGNLGRLLEAAEFG